MSQLRAVRLSVLATVVLSIAACGGSEGAQPAWTGLPPASAAAPGASGSPGAPGSPAASADASGSPAPSAAAPSGAAPSGGDTTEITIGTDTGAALQFDPTTATVPAGSTVQLTFENRATVPHNLTFGEPINVATETIVDPGASEPLEFTAPEPGDYEFVCTLHPGMEGVLTVEGG